MTNNDLGDKVKQLLRMTDLFGPKLAGLIDEYGTQDLASKISSLVDEFGEIQNLAREIDRSVAAGSPDDSESYSELYALRKASYIEKTFLDEEGNSIYKVGIVSVTKNRNKDIFKTEGGTRIAEWIVYATSKGSSDKKPKFLKSVRKIYEGSKNPEYIEVIKFLDERERISISRDDVYDETSPYPRIGQIKGNISIDELKRLTRMNSDDLVKYAIKMGVVVNRRFEGGPVMDMDLRGIILAFDKSDTHKPLAAVLYHKFSWSWVTIKQAL